MSFITPGSCHSKVFTPPSILVPEENFEKTIQTIFDTTHYAAIQVQEGRDFLDVNFCKINDISQQICNEVPSLRENLPQHRSYTCKDRYIHYAGSIQEQISNHEGNPGFVPYLTKARVWTYAKISDYALDKWNIAPSRTEAFLDESAFLLSTGALTLWTGGLVIKGVKATPEIYRAGKMLWNWRSDLGKSLPTVTKSPPTRNLIKDLVDSRSPKPTYPRVEPPPIEPKHELPSSMLKFSLINLAGIEESRGFDPGLGIPMPEFPIWELVENGVALSKEPYRHFDPMIDRILFDLCKKTSASGEQCTRLLIDLNEWRNEVRFQEHLTTEICVSLAEIEKLENSSSSEGNSSTERISGNLPYFSPESFCASHDKKLELYARIKEHLIHAEIAGKLEEELTQKSVHYLHQRTKDLSITDDQLHQMMESVRATLNPRMEKDFEETGLPIVPWMWDFIGGASFFCHPSSTLTTEGEVDPTIYVIHPQKSAEEHEPKKEEEFEEFGWVAFGDPMPPQGYSKEISLSNTALSVITFVSGSKLLKEIQPMASAITSMSELPMVFAGANPLACLLSLASSAINLFSYFIQSSSSGVEDYLEALHEAIGAYIEQVHLYDRQTLERFQNLYDEVGAMKQAQGKKIQTAVENRNQAADSLHNLTVEIVDLHGQVEKTQRKLDEIEGMLDQALPRKFDELCRNLVHFLPRYGKLSEDRLKQAIDQIAQESQETLALIKRSRPDIDTRQFERELAKLKQSNSTRLDATEQLNALVSKEELIHKKQLERFKQGREREKALHERLKELGLV